MKMLLWRGCRVRLATAFEGASPRVCFAFWIFGLINNIFYVLILTSALDLVGTDIPKATVLLSCIIPGLLTKIITPYVLHLIPHALRTIILACLSTCGMLAVALSPASTDAKSIACKIAGIVLANISSGAGEVCFLSLTHYYDQLSLASWSSGTGAAGVVGAAAYTLATSSFGFSVHATLMSSTVLPVIMLLSYFLLLPLAPLRDASNKYAVSDGPSREENIETSEHESAGLLGQPMSRSSSAAYKDRPIPLHRAFIDLKARLLRARALVVPYMAPLFLVYLAEYTINQGVAPTLLFPLASSPFHHFREFYPAYGTIYQLGVFISRSSLPFVRIRSLYIPSLLQVLNLCFLTAHALWPTFPNVWFVFAIILWEGLLGGLVYVSTFAAIREDIQKEDREFSLGATTVSDSGGIFLAGLLGAGLETALCQWQVSHGRGWCKKL